MSHYSNYYSSSGMLHVSLPHLMGTRLDALLFGDSEEELEALWNGAEKVMLRLEKMLNRFDPESEVARVNIAAQTTDVELSPELWQILMDCRAYYEKTGGCFDVTLSDFSRLEIMEERHAIRFGSSEQQLDFGGYAKGYALACVRRHLEEAGITRALIDFGNSSMLALGTHPYGDCWVVDVRDPYNGVLRKKMRLHDQSMSVSGNTPDHPQHIILKDTEGSSGRRMASGHIMTAVVTDSPTDAEVLTTAWIASGSASPSWLSRFEMTDSFYYSAEQAQAHIAENKIKDK